MLKAFHFFSIIILCISLSSCHGDYMPKPKAYPRIVYPEKKYEMYDPASCPFKFKKPVYAHMQEDTAFFGKRPTEPCWMNMVFPDFNGTINLTYKEINKTMTLDRLLDDAHKLSFKHTKKANFIDENLIVNKHGVSGIFYNVGGDAATNIQFFLTDSTHHYIRGSLYFFNEPNTDSMAPVLGFIRQDIDTMISTFEWK